MLTELPVAYLLCDFGMEYDFFKHLFINQRIHEDMGGKGGIMLGEGRTIKNAECLAYHG